MRKPNEKHPGPALTFSAPKNLANVTVILVEPAVPGNIGSAARAMKTMGLTDLVVLNGPKDFHTHQQAIMLGHGAGDLLEKSRRVTMWEEATTGLHWLVGTTHRKRRAQFPQVVEARQAAAKIAELSQKHRVGIVFGREEAGLSDTELRLCHDIVSVPQASEHPSLKGALRAFGQDLLAAIERRMNQCCRVDDIRLKARRQLQILGGDRGGVERGLLIIARETKIRSFDVSTNRCFK